MNNESSCARKCIRFTLLPTVRNKLQIYMVDMGTPTAKNVYKCIWWKPAWHWMKQIAIWALLWRQTLHGNDFFLYSLLWSGSYYIIHYFLYFSLYFVIVVVVVFLMWLWLTLVPLWFSHGERAKSLCNHFGWPSK